MNSTTIKAISSNKLLKNVDLDKIDHALIEGALKIVREGKIIYRSGDEAEELFLIIKGEVNFVYRESDSSNVKKMTKDDFFGHEDLTGDRTRKVTAVAATDLYLMGFSFDEFSTLVNYSPEIRFNAGIEEDNDEGSESNLDITADAADNNIYDSYEDDLELEDVDEPNTEDLNNDKIEELDDDDANWLHYADPSEDELKEPLFESEEDQNPENHESDLVDTDFENYEDEDISDEIDDSNSIEETENKPAIEERKPFEDTGNDDWSSYQEFLDSDTHEEGREKQDLFAEDSPEPDENEWETLDSEFQNYEDQDLEPLPPEEDIQPDQISEDNREEFDQFEKRELTTKGDFIESAGQVSSSRIEQDWLLQKLPRLFANIELQEILKQIVDIFNELFEPDHLGFLYSSDFNKKLKFVIDKNHVSTELDAQDASVNIPDFLDSKNPISLRSHEFNKDLIPEIIKDSLENVEGILYVPINSENRKFFGVAILVNETKEFDEQSIADANLIAKFCCSAIDNSIKLEAQASSLRNSVFDSFKKMVAQNVKQPLLLSESIAEYLKNQELSDEIRSALESLFEALRSASNGLLFFEDLDSSNDAKHKVKIDLNYLVKKTAENQIEKFENSKINFIFELHENVIVSVFPEYLKLCIAEILKNSFESMDKGEIKVSSTIQDQTVSIIIADNGIGIPIKERSKIFEPFYSYNKKDRIGLGLTIARAILNKYNGTIEINSKLDEGTIVNINLPASIE